MREEFMQCHMAVLHDVKSVADLESRAQIKAALCLKNVWNIRAVCGAVGERCKQTL